MEHENSAGVIPIDNCYSGIGQPHCVGNRIPTTQSNSDEGDLQIFCVSPGGDQ